MTQESPDRRAAPPEAEPAEAGGPRDGAAPAEPEAAEAPEEEAAGLELERVVAERDEYLDALQRLKAEFDNYRRRAERERQQTAVGASREIVRDLLPVMDNLERAVAALGDRGEQIVAGLEMVRGQLAGLLAGHGVEEIEALGGEFDPTIHEAVAQIHAPGRPEGEVVEVVEKGYRVDEIVLRPTRVVVAAGAPPEPPEDQES